MAGPGRKPLALNHVENLTGSQRAKQRLTTLLLTLESGCTIDEACQRLGVSESHFHALRHQWMQESLELLEPRAVGRPPRDDGAATARIKRLEEEVQQLRRELALAQARCDVLEVIGPTQPQPGAAPVKKGFVPR